MLKENTLRTFENAIISYEDFVKEVESLTAEGLDVYIGTDSQVIKNRLSVVTCVCFYKRGIKKNQIFYAKRREPAKNFPTLRSRMIYEAYKSLEAALEIDKHVFSELTVHLDIGTDPKRCKTAKFEKELRTLVKSQGFGCEVKPYSWASSSIADKYTKT